MAGELGTAQGKQKAPCDYDDLEDMDESRFHDDDLDSRQVTHQVAEF